MDKPTVAAIQAPGSGRVRSGSTRRPRTHAVLSGTGAEWRQHGGDESAFSEACPTGRANGTE